LIFCSEPVQPGGAAATSKDKALRKLKDDGQSATEGLYVFFSGHGFPWGPEPSRDFTNEDLFSSADNVHAQFDAFVADKYGRTGDELAHLVLATCRRTSKGTQALELAEAARAIESLVQQNLNI
jgi:hypothetical protein